MNLSDLERLLDEPAVYPSKQELRLLLDVAKAAKAHLTLVDKVWVSRNDSATLHKLDAELRGDLRNALHALEQYEGGTE